MPVLARADCLGLVTVRRESGRRYFESRALARAIDQLCNWGLCDFDADEDVEAYLTIARSMDAILPR
jgi:hypothetical protein